MKINTQLRFFPSLQLECIATDADRSYLRNPGVSSFKSHIENVLKNLISCRVSLRHAQISCIIVILLEHFTRGEGGSLVVHCYCCLLVNEGKHR